MNREHEIPVAQRVAVAFRGYNITNAGRNRELWRQPDGKRHLQPWVRRASELCRDVLGDAVDLEEVIVSERESTLETYSQDLALIVAIELGQWDWLQEILGERANKIRILTGYSLGEITATIVSGLLEYEQALKPILELSRDAAELAPRVTMGVLFSRGPAIDAELVREKCEEITCRGQGVLAISTYLSPNTLLLMGEGETIDLFQAEMSQWVAKTVHLRKNPNQWPPLHTPIVLQKHLRDRAAVMLQTSACTNALPNIPILSCITGDIAYNGHNTRHLLTDWVDHPQLLWDCIHAMLAMGVDQIIHMGPEPNIIPATMTRLADNVQAQMNQPSWIGYGMRTFSQLAKHRRWLTNLIRRDTVLLLAPHVQQIIFENFVLDAESKNKE